MTVIFKAHTAELAIVESVGQAHKIPVYDGPQAIPESMKDFIVFGCDDVQTMGLTGQVVAVDNGSQAYFDLGTYDKAEQFRTWLVLVMWDGGIRYAQLRARADAFVAHLEAALLPGPNDHTVNGPIGALGHSGVVNVAVTRIQQLLRSGSALHVQIAIDATTNPTNNSNT